MDLVIRRQAWEFYWKMIPVGAEENGGGLVPIRFAIRHSPNPSSMTMNLYMVYHLKEANWWRA